MQTGRYQIRIRRCRPPAEFDAIWRLVLTREGSPRLRADRPGEFMSSPAAIACTMERRTLRHSDSRGRTPLGMPAGVAEGLARSAARNSRRRIRSPRQAQCCPCGVAEHWGGHQLREERRETTEMASAGFPMRGPPDQTLLRGQNARPLRGASPARVVRLRLRRSTAWPGRPRSSRPTG